MLAYAITRRRGALAVMAWLSCALPGCTALLVDDAEQCASDGDCATIGLSGRTCSDGICVLSDACTSSATCVERAGGAPAACVRGHCVSLTSPDCTSVHPPEHIGYDETVFIGWMGPLSGNFASVGIPIHQAAALAFDEFEERANGIPGAINGERRALALIACHENADPVRAARHLVDTVRVPAIIGPTFSGIALDVATTVSIPGDTMLLSPSATSPAISGLNDAGLVWRTAPSDAVQAVPLALLLAQLETRIRADLALAPDQPIRVATAAKGDAYGMGLFDALTPIVSFNGKSATQNLADATFLPTTYDDPTTMSVNFTTVVDQLVAFKPHIVLPLGTTEGVTEIMAGVEAKWSGAAPRPRYLFTDGGRVDEMLSATQDESLRTRVMGTVPGRKGAKFDAFALRFEQRYGKTPGLFSENAYDAAYLIAYAIVAADVGVLDGASIAGGMRRMSEGALADVGPMHINTTFSTIASDGGIDFDGVSGPLDFDNATGEAPSDIAVWCVSHNPITSENVFTSSGQHYDATAEMLVGSGACD
jgi:branched-chain amino acid transport system substrate-binding protein